MSDLFSGEIDDLCEQINGALDHLSTDDKVHAINKLRSTIHQSSPFSGEPVDYVMWVKSEAVHANDYNPNSVAPPEMELLRRSIGQDGYTQPIVAMLDDDASYEVIDGFHRHRVGKEFKDVAQRVRGYLPIVQIRSDRTDKSDRMAATIRHNRARGKHKVDAMSDIVIELKRRNWTDDKIARELGMDADEVLRLCQITGLAEAFKDEQFSEAWEVGEDQQSEELFGEDVAYEQKSARILHTWDKWECYRAGFYAERCPDGMTQEDGEERYREFLADAERFGAALEAVTGGWKHSCEHYLTNDRMNRVAWLGQASVAQALGIPSMCRGGYHKLSDSQKYAADQLALKYLNEWLQKNDREQVMLADACGRTEVELY